MAFRFGDPGGRLYNTVGTSQVNLLSWWNSASNTASIFTITSSGGRISGNSLHVITTGAPQYISKFLDSQATWGIAFAIKVSSFAVTLPSILFALVDAASDQCDLRLGLDGTLQVTRNGTVLGTTTTALALNTWTHVEWKTLIHPSTGTTEVRINGAASGVALTGQNTRNTGNSSANTIALGRFLSGAGNYTIDLDDIIIYDGQVNDAQGNPDIHDWIGDCSLNWLLPNGVGTTTQFTADTGSNYARVNEATPDGDTSYVEDANVGDIDTYAMADLPGSTATVKSLAVVSYTRKSDVSSRGMKHELRTNSTNVAHTTEYPLSDSYQYFMSTWGQNPTGTPADWTVGDVNALEAGLKVSS